MAKQQPSPQQSERFVALQAALRQHFFAPSLNNLGNRIDVSTKTLSRYEKEGYNAGIGTLNLICDKLIHHYEISEEMFCTLPQQFYQAQMLYDAWKEHSDKTIHSLCKWVTSLSAGIIPENFPTEQHEKLNGLLQTRSSAFPWISLVLAHFFIKGIGILEGKPNEITVVLEALKNLDEHLAHHYPRRYGRNIFPQIELQLPTRNKNELSFQYYVQLAELMIGEYSNPDAERSPRMGSHLLLGTVSFWHKVGEAPADGHSLWVIREPTRTADGVLAPKAYSITEFVLESTTLRPVRHARISFNSGKEQLICTRFDPEEAFVYTSYVYTLNATDTQFHFTPSENNPEIFLPEALDRVSATHDDAGALWQRIIDREGESHWAHEAFLFELSLADLYPVPTNEMEVLDATRTRRNLIINLRHKGEFRDITFDNVDSGILKNVLPNDAVEIFFDRLAQLYAFYWPAHDELAFFDPEKTYEELISKLESTD